MPNDDKIGQLAQRISDILARLHQGDILNKHELAKKYCVNIRTIERDLGTRLKEFVEKTEDDRWQLALSARSTIPTSHLHGYARLAGTEHLFPDTSLGYLLEQLETPEPRRATHVQPTPHEDLQVDETRHFKPKAAHQDYINAKDDVWFTEDTTEVLLRVAPAMAHYFTRRPLLPRQQQRQDADGSLLVTTHINHMNQLLPVVRYWLPHVRIVQPVEWHEALVQGLREVVERWEPTIHQKESA